MADLPAKLVLPKPRADVPPEVVRPPFYARYRGWFRAIRLFLGLLVMALMVYGFLTYDFYTVPGSASGPDFMGVRRGDRLLIARFRFWRPPRVGDVVFYRPPGAAETEANVLGRVVGLPGEKVERVGPTMRVGGREPLAVGFELGPNAKIKDGDIIPEGSYLVLCDDDHVSYPDSRDYGYIPLENLQYRLALNISDTWGRGGR